MFLAFCDAAWRVVVLLSLGAAPYAAPVDVVRGASLRAGLLRLALFAVVAVGLSLVVRRSLASNRALALAVAGALLVAAVASWAFSGARGPLARGVWYVAPFEWAALAAAVSGTLGRRGAARGGAVVVILAIGMGSLLAAWSRLRGGDSLWRQALAIDRGNEPAALAVASGLRQAGDLRAAYETLLACAKAHVGASDGACSCDEEASSDAIDLGLYAQARAALEAPTVCPRTPRRMGLTAEALVGTSATDEGLRLADLALHQDPNDEHAMYARAWGTMLMGADLPLARKLAQDAVQRGRGLPANLLLGLIDFRMGDVETAAPLFEAALRTDPTNVQANYDAALVAQRRSRYHDAREGYLRVLRLDPTFADARYNLVGLTLNAGALGEAQHHLDELVAAHPDDPRIPALRAALARATAPPVRP